MADPFTLPAPELAALLCSRVCHDIISPVGAINNGLELLDEGGADEDAMNLIRVSARNASSAGCNSPASLSAPPAPRAC